VTGIKGQPVQSIIEAGDREFAAGNFQGAAYFFKKAIDKNNNITELYYKYAESLRLNREYSVAEKMYKIVLNENEKEFPLSVFWYAEMLKNEGLYDKAANYYMRFYKNNRQNKDLQYFILKSKYESVVCENLAIRQPSDYDLEIIRMDTTVNSDCSEFGAVEVSESLLYFSSSRPEKAGENSEFRSAIYFSKKENDRWQKALLADSLLNNKNYQSGNFTFDEADKRGYFSRCPISKNNEKCKIYSIVLDRDKWDYCVALPSEINYDDANSTQPCIVNTQHGKMLIFASDRKEGYGNYDIWYSKINPDGSFGQPVNAGSRINSIDDEITPFYYPGDTVLYFSSTWHGSLGGFDIFKAKGDFINWEEPVNLGKPVNSTVDDLYYWFNPETRNVYFSSNRKINESNDGETCCNDIYTFNLPFSHNDSLRMRQKLEKEAEITSEYIIQAKKLVPLTLYFDNDQPDPESNDSTTLTSYDALFHDYMMKIEDYKEGYSYNLPLEQKDLLINEINSFFLGQVQNGMDRLENFLAILEIVLKRGQKAEIILQSYASPLNTAEYNQALSKRRIECLKNFLISYKDSVLLPYFQSNRLILLQISYGETAARQGISDDINDLRNSVYSPAAAKERRIELIAVEILQNN
jgi:hypothetical protein